jgi:hypothetical protein
MAFNDPKWKDVDCEGEFTKNKYFGRFCLKPYLTHGERADAVRLAELYCRGINQDAGQRSFLTLLAFLKFHVTETDAEWFKDSNGLNTYDEQPFYQLADKLKEVQGGDKPTENEVQG